MEAIYKLRSELESKIDKIKLELKAMETIVTDMGKDQHPPKDFDERIKKLEEFEKQVRRKKAFKRKDG